MNDIAHNLAQVRDKISAAATRCGRSPEEITLLAVSKTKPASAIAEAIDAGQRQFGENYVQEGVDKIRHFQELGVTGLEWHFIGPLQSNKSRLVAEHFIPSTVCASLPVSTTSARQNFPLLTF